VVKENITCLGLSCCTACVTVHISLIYETITLVIIVNIL